jgi:hypothetical protein
VIKQIYIVLGFTVIITLFSCRKEKDVALPTVLKGHVADTIRRINISGYKIVLVKSWRYCANWMCGTKSEEVATANTDSNGDYSITFNYKLNPGESYALQEQYYGTPYYPEYYSGSGGIDAGKINTRNIYVWKPIELRLNVDVSNNNKPPLMIRNELPNSNTALFGTQNIYEQNIKKTYSLRARPNSDIDIIFWYYTGSNPFPVLHQKKFPYRTTLDDVIILNYTIDCSTF